SCVLAAGSLVAPLFFWTASVLSSFATRVFTVCSQVTTDPQKTETHFVGVAFCVAPAATPLRTRASIRHEVTATDLVVDLKMIPFRSRTWPGESLVPA